MARRRRRGLSYLPPTPRRTPLIIYLVLAAALVGAIIYVKQHMVTGMTGEIVDAYTGQPIANAAVTLTNDAKLAHTAGIPTEFQAKTDGEGHFQFPQATEKFTLQVEANNYRPSETLSYNQDYTAQIRLTPFILKGVVKDESGNPIVRASVTLADRTVATGAEGDFQFVDVPEKGKLIVKATGYYRNTVSFDKTMRQDVELKPFRAKGIYTAAIQAANPDFLPNLLNLINSTELNTLVVDLKDESGKIAFDSKQPLAKTLSDSKGRIGDLSGFVKQLHARNIYAVARMVIFLDPVLTDEKPEWALRSKSNGKLWADSAGYNWSNPYNQQVWEYNLALAKEVAEAGFDEIEFDYLRFPALGNLSDINFGQNSDANSRMGAIEDFLKRARSTLAANGTYISLNIFGLATLQTDDLEVGTKLETLADQVDYISPTLYPSSWGKGTFGYDQPAAKPYEMVRNALINAKPFLQGRNAMLRPWLQDFSIDQVNYGAKEVRDQIRAAEQSDTFTAGGWLLWNSNSRYTFGALQPKPENETRNNATITGR